MVFIGAKELEITCEVLKYYSTYSDLFSFSQEEILALRSAENTIGRELYWQNGQKTHSEVTLEMEQGKDIPLGMWARKHGLDESYARQKARRGSLKTAHKVGRDWFVSELEDNVDNRYKNI